MAAAQDDGAGVILRYYDAFTASFEATTQCAPSTSPDVTNLNIVARSVTGILRAKNPRLSPAEIQALLDTEREGVRKTVATTIAASGCDSNEIKQLRKNFIQLSAHATAPAGPAPNASAGTLIGGEAAFLFGRANYFRALVTASNCNQFDGAKFAQLARRFEQARIGFANKYGAQFFPADKPVNPPPQGRGCDPGMLMGYENHISEMEQSLAK